MNYHSAEPITGKSRREIIRYINLKLASMGQPIFEGKLDSDGSTMSEHEFIQLADSLLINYREKMRLLSDRVINPADKRIQDFICDYFQEIEFDKSLRLPFDSFVLDKPGIAREVSLPPDKNSYITEHYQSYRIQQGILHNPLHDRRTTKGSFHIVRGGLPIPSDKKAVPKIAFANMLHAALNPPENYMTLPFTASCKNKAQLFVSLLLRPKVFPEIPSVNKGKTMEIRFFVPGAFVSNLDFVESIFGNAGDPYLHKNDAGLDPEGWSGHTGCVILAPHLRTLKKKDLGLPHWEDASDRMRRDGMCWKDESELYNEGSPFKITCRDKSGVVITLIGDNYFGYSKKEVKTQISYAANLLGGCEEEHAGGAIAFARRDVGQVFSGSALTEDFPESCSFEDLKKNYSDIIDFKPSNYGIDKEHSEVIYIPENAVVDLNKSNISWQHENELQEIALLKNHYYVFPSGFKIHMEKHPFAPYWRLVLTSAEGCFMHKPNTVSGGGKSEISKSLLNAIIYGSFFVDDIEKDFAMVEEIISRDYSGRWKNDNRNYKSRSLMDSRRTLGSVIKLMTPYKGYTDEYNSFLNSIPDHVKNLVFLIKRISIKKGYEDKDWRELFSVDRVNGRNGHVLMFENRKLSTSNLRVGFGEKGSWNVFSLRPDFIAAAKVQMEDDISVSTTIPAGKVSYLRADMKQKSLKFVENCEYLFFQRPDEAINKGYDKQAESDLSRENTFATNYRPLSSEDAKEIILDAIEFDKFTQPIKDIIIKGAQEKSGKYFVSTSHPRILDDNTISKNPRYLQVRPEFNNPIDRYLANVGVRLARNIPNDKPVLFPVDDILPGRRNNPSDHTKGIRPLSVYGPIHYQQLPELFMDFICSLTGKSPSTTGAGSEGALTKGPFNMLSPATDLNNSLISLILSGYNAFSTPAGYIGPNKKFDHDISILIPELWCRLKPREKNPQNLIEEGLLDKIDDFEHEGELIKASRLGYRINEAFAFKYFGRIFEEPMTVFPQEVLKPELQSMQDFVDGIKNICEAQKKVALLYFEDKSVDYAIEPLKALLHIMAHGHYEGKDEKDPEIRKMFTADYVLNSEWYAERLKTKQQIECSYYQKQIEYIQSFMSEKINESIAQELQLEQRIHRLKEHLSKIEQSDYLDSLRGTIGADPQYK